MLRSVLFISSYASLFLLCFSLSLVALHAAGTALIIVYIVIITNGDLYWDDTGSNKVLRCMLL